MKSLTLWASLNACFAVANFVMFYLEQNPISLVAGTINIMALLFYANSIVSRY